MVARVVARSKLTGLTRNSVVYHVLAAATNEDADQYVQMARLREVFSIDTATGSDLDERAKEIQPGTLLRYPALSSSGTVVFSRPGTVGVTPIPAGSTVAASDAQGQILFRTTSSGSITGGNTTSGAVNVVCLVAGSRGNVAAGTITRFVSRVVGVTGVTNASKFSNGFDREQDDAFRARLKAWVQSLSRGTVTALQSYAKNVLLSDGRRVLFARVVEPITPTGTVTLYIEDGTGAVEEYSTDFMTSYDTLLASAAGGEQDLYTTSRPIRDDGSFLLELDTGGGFNPLIRGTDYELNPALGIVELDTGIFPTGLSAGDAVRANYRYYTGLIQETQRVIDGDPSTPTTRPGVRGAGVMVLVKAPATVSQSLVARISVLDGFVVSEVASAVKAAIQAYINTLDIGTSVIVAQIIEAAMAVDGMYNFTITSLGGSSTIADQIILKTQVARVTSAAIVVT